MDSRPPPPPTRRTLAAQVQALELLLDVQERIVLEQTERLEETLEQERRARRSLEALDRVARAIARQVALPEIVQLTTDAACELTGAAFGAFFENVDDDHGGHYRLHTRSGATTDAFDHLPMPRVTELFGPTFRGEAVVRLDDVTADPRYGRNGPYRGVPDGHLPVRAYLAVAVVAADGRVEGCLLLGHPEPGVFTAEAEALAQSVARHAAIAIANARNLEASQREAEARRIAFEERDRVARVLQESLLPPALPEIAGIELAARYKSGVELVGGDFYDVFPVGGGSFGLVLGDVCGRGPEAAAMTALTRHTARTAAMIEHSPARVIEILNDALLDDRSDRFVTAVFGRVTPRPSGFELRLCAAGHPPVLVARGDGRMETIEPETGLLGVYPDISPVERTIGLGPGDLVVFYTDGLVDTRRDGELFGEERLVRTLGLHRGAATEDLADLLLAASQGFAAGRADDDTALLILRVAPAAPLQRPASRATVPESG